MAEWYDKNGPGGDITMILDPRQHAGRKLGFADNSWTECRIGMFVSATTAAGDNSSYVNDSVAVSSVYDYMMFGLKNSDFQDTLMGQTDCDFWGFAGVNGETTTLSTDGGDVSSSNGFVRVHSTAAINFSVSTDATINSATAGTGNANAPWLGQTSYGTGATLYAQLWALRFVIANRGTSSQTVTIYFSNNGQTRYTDTSETNLRTLLTNYTSLSGILNSGSLTANTGAAAYDIPDAVFIRFPFISNRLRIHNIMAMQIAP